MTPVGTPSPPPSRRRSRAGLVDALLCLAAGVPLLGMVAGVPELFLFGTFALPVVVMLVCTLDPWTDEEVARLSGTDRAQLRPPPRPDAPHGRR